MPVLIIRFSDAQISRSHITIITLQGACSLGQPTWVRFSLVFNPNSKYRQLKKLKTRTKLHTLDKDQQHICLALTAIATWQHDH